MTIVLPFRSVYVLTFASILIMFQIRSSYCATTVSVMLDSYRNSERKLANGFQCSKPGSSTTRHTCNIVVSVSLLDSKGNYITRTSDQTIAINGEGMLDFHDINNNINNVTNRWLAEDYVINIDGKPLRLIVVLYHVGNIFNSRGELAESDFMLMDTFDLNLTNFMPVATPLPMKSSTSLIGETLIGSTIGSELQMRYYVYCESGQFGVACDMRCERLETAREFYRCRNEKREQLHCLVRNDLQAVNCTVCERFDGSSCVPVAKLLEVITIPKENEVHFAVMIAMSVVALVEFLTIAVGVIYLLLRSDNGGFGGSGGEYKARRFQQKTVVSGVGGGALQTKAANGSVLKDRRSNETISSDKSTVAIIGTNSVANGHLLRTRPAPLADARDESISIDSSHPSPQYAQQHQFPSAAAQYGDGVGTIDYRSLSAVPSINNKIHNINIGTDQYTSSGLNYASSTPIVAGDFRSYPPSNASSNSSATRREVAV